MQRANSIEFSRHPDSHLWWTAISLSLLASIMLLGLLGVFFERVEWRIEIPPQPKADESAVATLYLDPVVSKVDEVAPVVPMEKPFARTSPDQPASMEKTNERIGERSTLATSERAADPNAEALPSQFGVEPKPGEIETTESRYQDGELAETQPTSSSEESLPSVPSPPNIETSPEQALAKTHPLTKPVESSRHSDPSPAESVEPTDPTLSEERSLPPPRETLLSGPHSVDVNVPLEEGDSARPKETPDRSAQPPITETQTPTTPLAATPPSNASTQPRTKPFQGNQRKTAIVGSISRTGRSALNVDDSEFGRYQAAISKAVELEWQRNCMRHRDFITPGFLTVRFYVEPSGRVKSVNFLGEMETGEIQKGFTLSSIREAAIPKMPDELAKAYENDSLELVFRFYF